MDITGLSEAELGIILAALAAVSPSGGGSPQYTLLRKLREQTGQTETEAHVLALYATVEQELKQDQQEGFAP